MRVGEFAQYHSRNLGPVGFAVLPVDPVVPDHRCGHDDELSGERRIGEGLLIPAHSRREDDLGGSGHRRSSESSTKKGSVLKEEEPWRIARSGHDYGVLVGLGAFALESAALESVGGATGSTLAPGCGVVAGAVT